MRVTYPAMKILGILRRVVPIVLAVLLVLMVVSGGALDGGGRGA